MTKIKLYETDSTIHEEDKVIGTDGVTGADSGATKNFTIAQLGAYINALGVTSVTTTDGSFISLTPDTQTIGNVTVTADLSATGTPSSTTFLRGDNTWATINDVGGGEGTTYSLTSDQNSVNVDINLIPSSGTTDTVSLIAGTNITLVDDGSNNITINSTASGGGGIDGLGTATYLPVWEDSGTLTDSFLKAVSSANGGTISVGDSGIVVSFDNSVGSKQIRFAFGGGSVLTITENFVAVGGVDFQSDGYVKVGYSSDAASLSNAGAIRYKEEANNSYVEMAMKTGDGTYSWVIIKQNSW